MSITLNELIDFDHRIFRNIQGIPIDFDEFDDLTDNPKAKDFAHHAAANVESNLRLNEAQYNAIDFVFKQKSWLSSRFSNGGYPVLYGSVNLETSFHETLYHWQRIYVEAPQGFAQSIKSPLRTLRSVFTVNCKAALIDLRNKITENRELIDPDPNNYPISQQIGHRIHKEGHPGLITKSVRNFTGENIAVFKKEILSAPEFYQDFIYEYDLQNNNKLVRQKDSKTVVLGA